MDAMREALPRTFLAAMLHFFGKKPGQASMDFGTELKALTEADRAEFREMLKAKGYPIIG